MSPPRIGVEMVPFGNNSQFYLLYSSIPAGFLRNPACRLRLARLSSQNRAWNQVLGPIVLCKAAWTAELGSASNKM